jgi:hypothetical protein
MEFMRGMHQPAARHKISNVLHELGVIRISVDERIHALLLCDQFPAIHDASPSAPWRARKHCAPATLPRSPQPGSCIEALGHADPCAKGRDQVTPSLSCRWGSPRWRDGCVLILDGTVRQLMLGVNHFPPLFQRGSLAPKKEGGCTYVRGGAYLRSSWHPVEGCTYVRVSGGASTVP